MPVHPPLDGCSRLHADLMRATLAGEMRSQYRSDRLSNGDGERCGRPLSGQLEYGNQKTRGSLYIAYVYVYNHALNTEHMKLIETVYAHAPNF